MNLSGKIAKLAEGDVARSRTLCTLKAAGYEQAELPFSQRELSCWERKTDHASMSMQDVISSIKVLRSLVLRFGG